MKTKDLVPATAAAHEAKTVTEIALGIDRKHEQLMGDHQRLIHHLRRFMMYAGTGTEPVFPVKEPHRKVSHELTSAEDVERYLQRELDPFAGDAPLRFRDAKGETWIAHINITWEQESEMTAGG